MRVCQTRRRVKTLYLRIYLTVVAVLLLFALVAGWLLQRNMEHERARFDAGASERLAAWGELLQNALPPPEAPRAEQGEALLEWSQRLRLPLALDDANGQRIAASPSFTRWGSSAADASVANANTDAAGGRGAALLAKANERRAPQRVSLSDGRQLWIVRPARGGPRGADGRRLAEPPFFTQGAGLLVTLAVLFVSVALGAYPVVRRLTRRLEALQHGVEAFGAGALHQRVAVGGRDEVAALAGSFNAAAARIESLVKANQSLLANASHELRSPLTRLKMALAMLGEAPPERRAALQEEIARNIAELDDLVEEVLIASRLDAHERGLAPGKERMQDSVDVIGLAAEEAARTHARLELPAAPPTLTLRGDERLLRRAVRNLLENASRYGGQGETELRIAFDAAGRLELRVSDRGPGVPQAERERIFEPFYRLPGHAEQAGGVGLGLALVRQIARLHGGEVRCEAREGAGSCFVIALPLR